MNCADESNLLWRCLDGIRQHLTLAVVECGFLHEAFHVNISQAFVIGGFDLGGNRDARLIVGDDKYFSIETGRHFKTRIRSGALGLPLPHQEP